MASTLVKQELAASCLLLLLSSPLVATAAADGAPAKAEQQVVRFDISGYTVEGSTLLTRKEIDDAVAPYVGKDKDFSDVQHALEAIEAAYAKHGYTAVQVILPEQELDKGNVRFRAIESHFGKRTVKGNRYFSEYNIFKALPSLRMGGVPRSRQIARELRLANENPARQLNVVLKAGAADTVDAEVQVADKPPTMVRASFDNTGTPETGRTRLGLSYTNANLFDADHVGSLQMQLSPQQMSRVRVFGGSYKIPLYQYGDSMDFFAGYSNVNSLVGGLSNFKGGGRLFSAHYNYTLDRIGNFDPRLIYGFDWRDFKQIEQTEPTSAVLYNEIVVTPLSLGYAAQGKGLQSETSFDVTYLANVPTSGKGGKEAFVTYDPLGLLMPDASYRILRYNASYMQALSQDWQVRTALSGQWSSNVLILGEQMRLGGMNGVRGFSEGSEAGEKGMRWTVETYTPSSSYWGMDGRALVFLDGGRVSSRSGVHSAITSAGVGVRSVYRDVTLRLDVARIGKAGTDPLQKVGDWRAHFELASTF